MCLSSRLASLVICGLIPSLVVAGELPDRFTLGRYIPGNVFFYAHGVHNPERAWLDKEWAEVFDAFKASGIDRDIISLIMSALGEEDRAEVEATVEKWTTLLKGVRWGDLFGGEFAFAERMGAITKRMGAVTTGVDYFLLTRGKAGSAEANMSALAAILKQLAALADEVTLTNRELNGIAVWSLTFGPATGKEFPLSVELFRRREIIGLVTSAQAVSDVAALMSSKSEKRAIVATPRFKEAIAQVKSPEDSLEFFDGKTLFANMAHLMEFAAGQAKPEGDEKELKILSAVRKALDLTNVVDYIVKTNETKGRRELTHELTRLRAGKQKCALACCCLDRKPFTRFDEFIPVDATGFALSGLIDLEGLYKVVIDFIVQEVPDGPELIAKWNGLLASVGFDPKRDLFDWWSGEMVSVTLPAAVATPMSSADWVLMFRVKNSELASRKVNAAIDFVGGKAKAEGQMLMMTPAAVNAEGFRQITHPMLAMFIRPVIGVKDEWLTIGSSAGAVNKCFDVAAGKAPSITKNERFKTEGLIPKGPVLSCSFKDTSKFGDELGMAAGMIGMVGGMMSGLIPGPDAQEAKQVLQKMMGTIMKLGPVLQKIDFYSSESSVTTYDRALTVRTEKVVTYKPPSSAKAKTAQAE